MTEQASANHMPSLEMAPWRQSVDMDGATARGFAQ
jgi:hypothetical protein